MIDYTKEITTLEAIAKLIAQKLNTTYEMKDSYIALVHYNKYSYLRLERDYRYKLRLKAESTAKTFSGAIYRLDKIKNYQARLDAKPAEWFAKDAFKTFKTRYPACEPKHKAAYEKAMGLKATAEFVKGVLNTPVGVTGIGTDELMFTFWDTDHGYVRFTTKDEKLQDFRLYYTEKEEDTAMAQEIITLEGPEYKQVMKRFERWSYTVEYHYDLDKRPSIFDLEVMWEELKKLKLIKKLFVQYLTEQSK